MLKITSEADLLRLNPADPALPVLRELVERIITESYRTEFPFNPQHDGWLALCGQNDLDRPLTEIWGDDAYSLIDVPWEGVTRQDGMFIAGFLANNQFGIVFVIPENIVYGELLECFEAHMHE